MKPGQKIGPWLLSECLGKGGNGEVWKASRSNDEYVALKVLKNYRYDNEPYKRFKSEIEILQKMGSRKGVVRLLDSFLPQRVGDPEPWLAMEIGMPIKDALGKDSPIDDVIKAIAEIAVTLSLLAREGIHHRDIKPDNLFRVADGWAIGDFGLVSYPKKETLTEEGHKLGPMFYIAPEMLNNALTSAGGPADVYSLAKTLWVLSTGQNYPLPGPHQSEIEQVALRSYLKHPRIALLDILLEKATQYNPLTRSNMKQFAEELQAWLIKPFIPTPPQDISESIARMHPVLTRLKDKSITRQEQIDAFERMVKDVSNLLKPFQVICRRDLMGIEQTKDEINSPIQTLAHEWLDQVLPVQNENRHPIRHERPLIEAVCRPSGVLSSDLHGKTDIIYYGIVDMILYEGGDVFFRLAHIVERQFYPTPQDVKSEYDVVWEASQTVSIPSAIAEVAMHNLLNKWSDEFRKAIELFVDFVENANS